jgi:NAD(P)-dependent dehydrogenase (short-subunit alcohol dehydrogenase family)
MSAQRFQGKVAVVTGGNSGIGLGVAKAYAREGAQVAITGRNEKTLEAAAKEIGEGTLAIQSDAGTVAEIEAAMKKIQQRFGRIDALFVNAGVAKLVPFEQVTEELFDETVDINLKGVFFTVRKAMPKAPPSCSMRRSTRTWACRGQLRTARPKRAWLTWLRPSQPSCWTKGFG